MALPLVNAAENEDEDALVHGSDTAGYAQLPSDHLSDSSESSNGSSCNVAFDTLITTPHRHDIPAATHNDDMNDDIPFQIVRSDAHIDGIENEAATEAIAHDSSYQNGHHVTYADAMQNQGLSVLHIDGMEVHVYGQLAGLQISSPSENSLYDSDQENIDDEDDIDEIERQRAEDAAFQRAKEADDIRRLAPLPPDRCQAIKKAMQSISLGGFQPEWANKVPEEQWVNKLRRKLKSNFTQG